MAIANSDGSIVLSLKISTQKAIGKLKGDIAKIAEGKNAFYVLSEEAKRYQNQIKDLERQYALLLSKQDEFGENKNLVGRLEDLRKRIEYNKEQLKETNQAISFLGKKATKSFSTMAAGAKNFGKRIAGIIKSALIFSVLYRVMQSVVKLFNNILMSDEEFRQDWEELKAAFYTAAYPIINLIVPAIKWIVQQVRDWAVSIGKVAAALQGMSYSELVDQAKASKEAADNYADMEKSSKKTADNVKKQLASFDDIQILSSGKEEEQGESLAGFEGLGKYDTSGEKSMLDDLMKAIGGALVAVGLILLFKGQIGWGIGFIIAGAVAGLFGVAIAKLSDENVSQKAKDELSSGMMIVGIIAVVLGILLCMAQQWGLGIGIIAVGVASIVTPIALNWDGIKEQLQGSFGGWLAVGGLVAIVLGVLLCFAQVWGLGLGLIALGIAGIVAPIVANWDAIVDLLSSAWDAVKQFWNRYIAPVFTAKFWLDLAKNCGNGLIGGFEAAINGIIGMFERMINWIVDGLNNISFDVPDWVPLIGGKIFGFNIPRASFGRLSIPRLAQGAVIPPNREFLAVLGDQKQGTNIEAPLSTIQDAVSAVVSVQNDETQYILREILEAILGIQIGDEVIGRASQRYNNSMIKMYGG